MATCDTSRRVVALGGLGTHPGWPRAGSLAARRAGPAHGAREPGRLNGGAAQRTTAVCASRVEKPVQSKPAPWQNNRGRRLTGGSSGLQVTAGARARPAGVVKRRRFKRGDPAGRWRSSAEAIQARRPGRALEVERGAEARGQPRPETAARPGGSPAERLRRGEPAGRWRPSAEAEARGQPRPETAARPGGSPAERLRRGDPATHGGSLAVETRPSDGGRVKATPAEAKQRRSNDPAGWMREPATAGAQWVDEPDVGGVQARGSPGSGSLTDFVNRDDGYCP